MALLRGGAGLVREVVAAWWHDDGLRLGAALSYYTAFSLAPVPILSVAVGGLAFGAEAASGRIVGELGALMGADGARAIQTRIELTQALEQRHGVAR